LSGSDWVDLHLHTTCSDGTLSPAELVRAAAKAQLLAAAVTDHDSVSGVAEAQAEAEKLAVPMEIIPGVELSCAFQTRDIHIVGLFIDPENRALTEALAQMVAARDERNRRMADNLAAAGYPVTYEELVPEGADFVLTRAGFAELLVAKGCAKDNNDAFARLLSADGPYYVPRKLIEPEDAVRLILGAGRIPIMTHPMIYRLPYAELFRLAERLKRAGLMGIEVLYSSYSRQDEDGAFSIANQLHLLYSGGSDFHGANKPDIAVGTGRGRLRVPYSYVTAMKKALRRMPQ